MGAVIASTLGPLPVVAQKHPSPHKQLSFILDHGENHPIGAHGSHPTLGLVRFGLRRAVRQYDIVDDERHASEGVRPGVLHEVECRQMAE